MRQQHFLIFLIITIIITLLFNGTQFKNRPKNGSHKDNDNSDGFHGNDNTGTDNRNTNNNIQLQQNVGYPIMVIVCIRTLLGGIAIL